MAIAMVAEQREVYRILSELFSADGNEMYVLYYTHIASLRIPCSYPCLLCYSYLRPIHWFVKEGVSTSFYEISHIAKKKGQLVFGYKLRSGDLFINPRDKTQVIEWAEGDTLLILAMD